MNNVPLVTKKSYYLVNGEQTDYLLFGLWKEFVVYSKIKLNY